jgi:hypothetical protein
MEFKNKFYKCEIDRSRTTDEKLVKLNHIYNPERRIHGIQWPKERIMLSFGMSETSFYRYREHLKVEWDFPACVIGKTVNWYLLDEVYSTFGVCRDMISHDKHLYFSRKRLADITGFEPYKLTRKLQKIPTSDPYVFGAAKYDWYTKHHRRFVEICEETPKAVLYHLDDVLDLFSDRCLTDVLTANELITCFERIESLLDSDQRDHVLNLDRTFYHNVDGNITFTYPDGTKIPLK